MNGIINVYKERGFTSHDVVAKLRGILHMKKIGHTGTLDPDATGVLPVCIGKATKVCGLLTDKDKTYRAVVKLGVTTNTEDMTGEILSHVVDKDGKLVKDEFEEHLLSLDLEEFKKIPIRVGVAYGLDKKEAILGVLRGGYVNVLITDEKVANYLIEETK